MMKKLFTFVLLSLLTTVSAVAEDTWTIAGSAAICGGQEWKEAATENDMTTTDGVEYKLVKEGCVLEKGVTYECKVVKNHSWTESYPSSNYKFTVQTTGRYTVTFSWNAEFKDLSVETLKTGEATVGDKSWTMAGEPAALFGTEWDPANTDNDMEKQSDGTYKLEIKNATLSVGKVQYKVCANHGWSESYGANGGSDNAILQINEDGAYDVTFTFNPQTKDLGAEATKTSDVVIEKGYSLAGVFEVFEGEETKVDEEATVALFGKAWDETSADNDMWKEGSDYVFEKTGIKLPVGQIACKVLVNHSWGENYGADGVMDGDNVFAPITQGGTYNVKFTFNPETKILVVETTMTAAGIDTISTEHGTSTAIRYDLSGRRIGTAHKGVVIMDGKKVAAGR